jgi:hypothetical protein
MYEEDGDEGMKGGGEGGRKETVLVELSEGQRILNFTSGRAGAEDRVTIRADFVAPRVQCLDLVRVYVCVCVCVCVCVFEMETGPDSESESQ